jgi:hypothetical protein
MRKPPGNRSLERPRRRWEDNIKTDFERIGSGDGKWVEPLRIVSNGGLRY